MSVQVTVVPSQQQFTVDSDETVLAAAIKAGIGLPYSCRNGACSSCKGKVIEGQIALGNYQKTALSDEEIAQGVTLFCSTYAQSDLLIEVKNLVQQGEFPVKKVPCRVLGLNKMADDVMELTLQLPATEQFKYRAGQYIDILLRDGRRRSFSMAKAPHEEGPMVLHIRHLPGGVFTDQVFGVSEKPIKERDILRFEGPLGSFVLDENSDKPIVFLASGTGFAPIRALVEHIRYQGIERPIKFYWGGRRPQDLYGDDEAIEWSKKIKNFDYIPVVSEAHEEDNWQGRSGFVHKAVMEDIPDLSMYQVYACGVPVMVDSARRDFVEHCGLPSDSFFADSFVSELDNLS